MKKRLIYCQILLNWLLILSLVNYVSAQKIPGYVRISEDRNYYWQVEVDDSAHKDLIADYYDEVLGYSEDGAESMAEFHIDNTVNISDEIEGVRNCILEIYEEQGDHGRERRVKYDFNYYITEDYESFESDWDIKKRDTTDTIYNYDKDRYADIFEDYIVWNETTDSMRSNDLPWSRILGRAIELDNLDYFIARNVKWHELAQELFLDYEDEGKYTIIDDLENGLEITIEEDDDMGDIKFRFVYINGILTHYSWKYDGDIIIHVEMEDFFYYSVCLSHNIWLLITVGIICLVALTILIILLIFDIKL